MPDALAFKCSVCGAPAHGGDFSCRYCGAELGLLVESALQSSQCSDCHGSLEIIREPAGSLLNCRKCGGQFVEHALLRSLLEAHEQTAQAFPDAPYQRPSNANAQRVQYRPCSVCQRMMNRRN